MSAIESQSFAKINLFLGIVDTRPDGYHNLEMINAKISLCDDVSVDWASSEGVHLTVSDPTVPADARNTASKAAERFLAEAQETRGVDIHLEKRIPHGAGLGGGSGNAATTLLALNQLVDEPLPKETLHRIGVSIGADVPFFLEPGCCYVSGIGERVERLELTYISEQFAIGVVVCSPKVAVETGGAYGLWDRMENKPQASPKPMLDALKEGDWPRVIQTMFNAFEYVIFPAYPEIQNAYDAFREISPTPPRLSGSGSNLFSLHTTLEEAEGVAQSMAQEGYAAGAYRLIV